VVRLSRRSREEGLTPGRATGSLPGVEGTRSSPNGRGSGLGGSRRSRAGTRTRGLTERALHGREGSLARGGGGTRPTGFAAVPASRAGPCRLRPGAARPEAWTAWRMRLGRRGGQGAGAAGACRDPESAGCAGQAPRGCGGWDMWCPLRRARMSSWAGVAGGASSGPRERFSRGPCRLMGLTGHGGTRSGADLCRRRWRVIDQSRCSADRTKGVARLQG